MCVCADTCFVLTLKTVALSVADSWIPYSRILCGRVDSPHGILVCVCVCVYVHARTRVRTCVRNPHLSPLPSSFTLKNVDLCFARNIDGSSNPYSRL